jgi:hypothetical protein
MGDLINFLSFITEIVMWYLVFKTVAAFWEAYCIYKDAKEIEIDLHDKLTKLVHNVKPEKHEEVHYWFDEETDKFLAQGKDLTEIRTHLRERFTQDVFLVDGKILLAGPEFTPMDISNHSASEVGKYIADNLMHKMLHKNAE